MPQEFDFIDWIRSRQTASAFVPVPAGDDLAVLQLPGDCRLLVGADQVLDGVHVDSAIHAPRDIGRKAMNRNLSDCAAMACLPAAALVTFALPQDSGIEFARELYLGIEAAGAAFDCPIIGGDTGSWPGKLAVSVTILGNAAGIAPVQRSGAMPGDGIYVTGPLGGSILGRHMTFTPRISLARELAQIAIVHVMIDLSDGLSRDLAHLCRESCVGAVVQADKIPIHGDAETLAQRDSISAIDHALHDGEDYELLFAAPPTDELRSVIGKLGIYQIGLITDDKGVSIDRDGSRNPLRPQSWEHPL